MCGISVVRLRSVSKYSISLSCVQVVDFRPTTRDAVAKPQYSKAELEEQMAKSLELIKHRGPGRRALFAAHSC